MIDLGYYNEKQKSFIKELLNKYINKIDMYGKTSLRIIIRR